MAFGECRRVWRVRAKQVGECRRVWRVHATWLGECRRVWRVRAARLGKCRQVWRVLAKPLDEYCLKQDWSFYAQITYFICIKQSSLHSLNSPNSRKTRQTCLSRVWRVLTKWFGECWRVWRVRATWMAWQMSASLASLAHFRKRPFWQVLEFAKNGEFPASIGIR